MPKNGELVKLEADSKLSRAEAKRRAELESVIRRGFSTFVEVGLALLEIRRDRLYRDTHGNFEAYCLELWAVSKTHANRLASSVEVVGDLSGGIEKLTPIGVNFSIPFEINEAQARELVPLDSELRRQVWAEVTAPGQPPATAERIRGRVRELRILEALDAAGSFPPGTFSVLCADPPWEYSDQRTGGIQSGAASAHYPSLPTASICNLADSFARSVRELLQGSAALFLWATAPCLPDAMQVIEAWGFEYKAQFVWDKVRGFNGHYNDVRHELLLIALRGSFQPQCEKLRGSIVTAEKTKHSRKPEVFYEIIEEMYPVCDPPTHLEIFARERRTGWESWGNEA